jgi:hypothetical protein
VLVLGTLLLGLGMEGYLTPKTGDPATAG